MARKSPAKIASDLAAFRPMKSNYAGSTLKNIRYQLGGIVDGKLYVYTQIPAAKTLALALAAQAQRPGRSRNDVIIEEGDLVRGSTTWGRQTVLHSAADGSILPDR